MKAENLTADGRGWTRIKRIRESHLRLSAFICGWVLLCGCAHFTSRQIETAQDGTQRVTRISVWTFFDAHNDVAKLRASTTDKTQGVSLAGLDQTASSTNAVDLLRLIGVLATLAK